MNERIKELAKQAKFAMEVSNDPNSPPSWWGAGHNDTFERFAELLVRECVEQINKVEEHGDAHLGGGYFYDGTRLCRDAIKKHFGVES